MKDEMLKGSSLMAIVRAERDERHARQVGVMSGFFPANQVEAILQNDHLAELALEVIGSEGQAQKVAVQRLREKVSPKEVNPFLSSLYAPDPLTVEEHGVHVRISRPVRPNNTRPLWYRGKRDSLPRVEASRLVYAK